MAINTSNTLLDNSAQFRMVDYLTALLRDERHTELKIATGYWDLPGTKLLYEPLKEFFERGGKLDLLIGQEPILRAYQLDENALTSIKESEKQYPDFYLRRDVEKLNADYQPTAQLLIDHINPTDETAGQMRVHIYGKEGAVEFLHAKCYIFLGCGAALGIVGSSNFTKHGLEDNAELNHMETNTSAVSSSESYYSNTKSHLVWFNEKWDNSTPWNGEFIQILQGLPTGGETHIEDAVINDPLNPYEVYIRMLQDRFDVIVDDTMDKPLQDYLQGTTYQVQPYQLAAVKHCYYKMRSMGGFLLGDVVGLGKTIEALLLACYFVEHHEEWRSNRVLIIAPPAVLNSWRDSVGALDKANPALSLGTHIDFLSSGGVGNLADADFAEEQKDYEAEDDGKDIDLEYNTDTNYGLILIDESHKFRNRHTRMYESLEDLISGINSRKGYYPYIGLLSATPQNNAPRDIESQILLFEHQPRQSRFDSIPRRDLEDFFAKVNKQYDALKKGLTPSHAKQGLIALAQEVREKILDSIMVRRTRADITRVYGSTFAFPDIVGPVRLDYTMDSTLARLFSDTMDAIGKDRNKNQLHYARYRAIEYLTVANQQIYTQGSMTATKSADALAGIIQILLVKRLESSFAAFIQSLRNQKRYIENMLQMIADDCIFICPDLDVNAELANASSFATGYTTIRAKMATKNSGKKKANNNEFHSTDFHDLPKYKKMLQQDWQIVDNLLKRWENWEKSNPDPKLEEFKQRLTSEVMQPDSMRLKAHIDSFVARYPIASQTPGQQDEYKRLSALQKTITPADKGKLVIFSEAIDTVEQLEKVCTVLGYHVLAVTAANRKICEPIIKANFDANCPKDEQQDDYDIIITTEVLSEGINLHRANAIINYDTPWNATKLIQRIGRVNRIGSTAKAVFVYNFFPSADGNTYIHLVQNAYAKLQSFHVMFGEDNPIFSSNEEIFSYSAAMNGVSSAESTYLEELRKYKDDDPLRYAQIKAAPTPLAASMSDTPETAVCAVKDKETMYYQVDTQTLVPKDMSYIDAFEACKCNPNPAPPDCALPANLQDINEAALQAYYNYRFQLAPVAGVRGTIPNAINYIQVWQRHYNFAQDVIGILNTTRISICLGDTLLARRIVKIGKDIDAKAQTAAPYTQQDVEDVIRKQLAESAKRQQANAQYHPANFITITK